MKRIRVALAVVTRDDDVLIIQRVHKEPGLDWCFPGGKADQEEDVHAAATREVLEETDIAIQPLQILGEKPYPFDANVTLIYIHCAYLSGKAKNLEPGKHEAVKWVKADELPNILERDYTPFIQAFFQGRSQ